MLVWLIKTLCGETRQGPALPSSEKEITDGQLDRLRNYAWKHFSYHAEQRMKCFNYFVLLIAAVTTGVCAIVGKSDQPFWLALLPLGIFLMYFSHLFEQLDQRNQELVNLGREALKVLDQIEAARLERVKIEPNDIRSNLFHLSLMAVDDKAKRCDPDHFSHRKAFSRAFRICRVAGQVLFFGTLLGYAIYFVIHGWLTIASLFAQLS